MFLFVAIVIRREISSVCQIGRFTSLAREPKLVRSAKTFRILRLTKRQVSATRKREDIAELLLTGTKPDFDNVQGLMAEVIQGAPHGFKDMRREDALAIADYLKSIPAIKNKIK